MLVTVDRYCELTGRTEYAVRSYINKGVWTEGAEFGLPVQKRRVISLTAALSSSRGRQCWRLPVRQDPQGR